MLDQTKVYVDPDGRRYSFTSSGWCRWRVNDNGYWVVDTYITSDIVEDLLRYEAIQEKQPPYQVTLDVDYDPALMQTSVVHAFIQGALTVGFGDEVAKEPRTFFISIMEVQK